MIWSVARAGLAAVAPPRWSAAVSTCAHSRAPQVLMSTVDEASIVAVLRKRFVELQSIYT